MKTQSTQHGGVWLAAVMSFVFVGTVLAHGEVRRPQSPPGADASDMSVDECAAG